MAPVARPPVRAADLPFTVRITTSVPAIPFFVDGQVYMEGMVFTWLPGSRHILSTFLFDHQTHAGTRYDFVGWFTGDAALAGGPTGVAVTADPAVTTYTAVFSTQYRLGLRYFTCAPGAACDSPGVIHVNGTAYNSDTDWWVAAGDIVRLRPEAAPGWAFAGWAPGPSSSVERNDLVVTMVAPLNVYPRFVIARRVAILSEPPGFRLMADYNPVVTPVTLDWGWDTMHSLAPVSPQTDAAGALWVFRGWSDGGDAVRMYHVEPGGYEAALTARFARAARVSLLTSPPLLKLRVDGRDNAWSYNFDWGVGETHRVEAPETQADSQGRMYVFCGWSNGAASGALDVTVTEADLAAGIRLTAQYELLGRVVVQANVPGGSVSVQGTDCPLPCTLDRPAGTSLDLIAPGSMAAGPGVRYDFRGWEGGGAPGRTTVFSAASQTLSLSYAVMYRIETASDPPEAANWRAEPPAPDGYYEAQTTVALTVQANPGFRFRFLEGNVHSAFSSAFLRMDGPKFIRAVFEAAPQIPAAAVRNGAGETPDPVVATGSIITIFGSGLSPSTEIGPASPLVQTLAGVTVRAGDRLLPLLYVSPTQINAQLPAGVEPGMHSLAVRWERQPEVRTDFEVVRNAPGLFQYLVEDRWYAIALHEDGSLITRESPARREEIITLFGTGFGPCDRQPPDGFALPENPRYTLLDPVEVFAAGMPLEPLWAGASPGRVGVQEVRLRIAPGLPAATAIPLAVRIGNRDSNTVLVPLE